MRRIREWHVYLSCLFAPALVFFVVSGFFQTWGLHQDLKSGWQAPAILKYAAAIHMSHAEKSMATPLSYNHFRFWAILTAVGVTITTLFGMLMAFQFIDLRRKIAVACLVSGVLIPVVLLLWK